jgi:hypothetical protein
LGQGYNYFVNGRNLGPGEWNNLGLQDVMPTWRWVIDSPGAQLTPSFDLSDAYVGGSSLRVSGQLTEQNDLRLYMTRLPVTAETKFQLAFKTGVANQSSNMAILLAFEDSSTTFTAIPAGRSLTAEWDLKSFDLSAFAGRTIAQIGLRFLDVNASNYNIKIGRLGVIEGTADIPTAPSNVTLQDSAQLDHQNATLRLLWEHSPNYSPDAQNQIYYYNVYHKDSHGEREFLGGTTNNAFFVGDLNRSPGEISSLIEVIAVGTEFGESLAATFTFNWIAAGGDLNNDSHVNAADWLLFRPNQGGRFPGMTPAQTASLGDLDGDLDNDLDDFTLFIEDFEGAAGAGSFARMLAGVPEPQSAMLLAIGLAVAMRTRRQIPWRAASFATAVVASTITIIGEACSQTYTLLRTPIAASSSSMGGPDNGIERFFDDASLTASHLGTRVYTSGSSQYAGNGLGPHNVFMEFRAPILANTIADGVPATGFVRYTDGLPSDFDADGDVDGSDFLRWQRNVGAMGTPAVSQGNADGDSDVDGADLAVWSDHFGFVHVLASASAAPSPEPASAALAISAVATLLAYRRPGGEGTRFVPLSTRRSGSCSWSGRS